MDGSQPARIAAIVIAAIAITAAVELTRKEAPAQMRPASALRPPADPLRASLRRCQELGEAAAHDAGCLALWAETRDRFLGRDLAPDVRQPGRER